MSAAARPTLRVAFAGTPEFAAVALRAIVAAGHTVPLVLTQPDRPAGRGLKLQPSAVKAVALEHALPVAQPQGLRLSGKFAADAEAAQATVQAAQADVMVVAAYGLILPAWVLQAPRLGCLNIHGSLLPRWRGAAPIQRAIEAGDSETGIAIMQMDEGLDTGEVLLTERLPITADDTSATLYDKLARLGAAMVVQALDDAARGALQPRPQTEVGVTYAHKISKDEAAIDWCQAAELIERRVRAFDPFPGATFSCGSEVVKLWRARVLPGQSGKPGTLLQADPQALVVACGEQALQLLEVQRPGGRRQPAAGLLQAFPALRAGRALNL